MVRILRLARRKFPIRLYAHKNINKLPKLYDQVLDSNETGGVNESALVEAIFKDGGSLMKVLDFENRPEQSEMADAVGEAFLQNEGHLLFEAGTGVGEKPGVSDTFNHSCQKK